MNVSGEPVTKKKTTLYKKAKIQKTHDKKKTSIKKNQERDVKSESERDTMHKRSSSANHRLLETLPSLEPDWGHIVSGGQTYQVYKYTYNTDIAYSIYSRPDWKGFSSRRNVCMSESLGVKTLLVGAFCLAGDAFYLLVSEECLVHGA